MNPTRPRTLVALALVSALVAFLGFRAGYGSLPPVPVSMGPTLLVLAAAEAFLAPSIRARLDGRPRTKPIMPIAVARAAAFAKSSSCIGAVVVGAMVGIEAYVLRNLVLPAARVDAFRAALAIGGGAALVAAALWLEKACRADPPPPGP